MLNFLKFFPNKISELIYKYNLDNLEEIRIRVSKPIILKYSFNEIIINYKPTQEELLKILQFMCDNSIYSYQNQIIHRLYHSYRGT